MNKSGAILLLAAVLFGLLALFVFTTQNVHAPIASHEKSEAGEKPSILNVIQENIMPHKQLHPMAIESLRGNGYPGGEFTIEQTLANGTNYRQYIASYRSEGLKIYGLLTIPLAEKPEGGYPAVMFVHGYIQPDQYSTTGNYPTYQAALARGGFITFKPDLRGHGNSEGEPVSAHYSEKYTIDTLNALAYLKQHPDVNSNRIGYWGHSNGGEIGLRTILVDKNIKAASLWAGVVGSYQDMFETYLADIPFLQDDTNPLVAEFSKPSTNPEFWNAIEPYEFLDEISIPIQLQHGTNDTSVPVELSLSLKAALEEAGKDVTYLEYPGDDHNIGQNSSLAWQRTIAFFRENL